MAKLGPFHAATIQRWRDGVPADTVTIPLYQQDSESDYDKRLQVADSGRIWLKTSKPSQLWAFDGTHVASGMCPFPQNLGLGGVQSFLSRDGTILEYRCSYNGISDYFDLQVNGEQVNTAHHAFPDQLPPVAKTSGGKTVLPSFYGSRPPESDGWFYCTDERTDIYCCKSGSHYRLLSPRQQVDWTFDLYGIPQWVRSSPDGRFALVLMRDEGLFSGAARTLARLPFLRDKLHPHPALLLVERPGQVRAQLPLIPPKTTATTVNSAWTDDTQLEVNGKPHEVLDWGIAPDGHRLGLLVKDAANTKALLLYKWGTGNEARK